MLPSWVSVAPTSHFPLNNLPYGIFSTAADPRPRPGVAIGDSVLDLAALSRAGLFSGPILSQRADCLQQVGRRRELQGPAPPLAARRSPLPGRRRLLSTSSPFSSLASHSPR